MSPECAITAQRLTKRYAGRVVLDAIELSVGRGEIFALLGPNGAGKSTTMRILTTAERPDGGYATVLGHDVVREAHAVRRSIGVVSQHGSLDEHLTGRENVELLGWLSSLGRRHARTRADELLERFELCAVADDLVRTYSGGTQRRLDVAAGLIARPPVLFLDEPTTGLDPRCRNAVWRILRELAGDGTTILLTTQQLEEADVLALRAAVLDRGRIVAQGTIEQLKRDVGGERLEFVVLQREDLDAAARLLAAVCGSGADVDRASLRCRAAVADGPRSMAALAAALVEHAIAVDDLALRRPTLDDVVLSLTSAATPSARLRNAAETIAAREKAGRL